MKFTNLHGLPAPMVQALSQGWPPSMNTLSVSSLIGPPRIRTLTMKHWGEMEEDVSGRLWALLGQGLHAALAEHAANKEILVEQGIKTMVKTPAGEILVSGRPDAYSAGVIDDYKITSVFSFLLGDKPEWENQLNVYAFLYRSAGFPVKELNIQAILRDWTESKSLSDADYPKIPFITVKVPLWTPEDAGIYVNQRVEFHLTHPMDPCSELERWAKPATFAVMKVGNKRALRLLETVDHAMAWAQEHNAKNPKDKLEIHERKGEYVRCARYCAVRQFCEVNPYTTPPSAEGETVWEELE